jgi:hypothetical protein
MPFALIFIGLLMVVSGMRDTHADLGRELVDDIGGKGGFGTRLLAIGAVGSLGYMGGEWRRLSTYFMVLVLIALLFSADKGFFAKLTAARQSGPSQVTAAPAGTTLSAASTGGASTFSSLPALFSSGAAPASSATGVAPANASKSPFEQAGDFIGTYGKYLMFLL